MMFRCGIVCDTVAVGLRQELAAATKLKTKKTLVDTRAKVTLALVKAEICWVYEQFLTKTGVL